MFSPNWQKWDSIVDHCLELFHVIFVAVSAFIRPSVHQYIHMFHYGWRYCALSNLTVLLYLLPLFLNNSIEIWRSVGQTLHLSEDHVMSFETLCPELMWSPTAKNPYRELKRRREDHMWRRSPFLHDLIRFRTITIIVKI